MKSLKKKIYILLPLFVISSCTTTLKINPAKPPVGIQKETTVERPAKIKLNDKIDYSSLQRLLGLDIDPKKLGYFEKAFDTCQVGFGYSKTENCRAQFLSVAHFRLLCRDSEGTISTILTDEDLRPVPHQEIRWFLKNADGALRTDSEGYGQIVFTAAISQKNQRLRLSNRKDFLLLRASDARQLIVPKNWCAD